MATILIAANIIVFLIIAGAGFFGFTLSDKLGLPASFSSAIRQPWTIITYSVSQANLLQLLFNMLWLFGFGKLFLMRATDRMLLIVYASGGVAGGLFYLAAGSLFNISSNGLLLGSSAAVIAVATAVAAMMPNLEITLPLFGPTKIKWVVGVVILIFFIGLSTPNAGGNLAHIGGVAAGIAAARIIAFRGKTVSSPSTEYEALAGKIKKSGFESLSAKERRRFFELSNKNR